MTTNDPYNKPKFPNTERLQDTLNDIRGKAQEAVSQQPPEVKERLEKSKSFYERNQKAILTGVAVIVVLKVNKRKVAKATAKAVAKEMKKVQPSDVESFDDIVRFLRATPGMSYIARGSKAMHVLLDNNTVLTFLDNFDQMTDSEVNQKLITYFTKAQLHK